ncbi:hypothetical protein KR059_004258, partial [Drosophila kikkawai]
AQYGTERRREAQGGVYDVDSAISPEEFMQELHANNFGDEMTASEFKKAVHLVTKAWSVIDGATVNVTLEMPLAGPHLCLP